MACSSLTRNRGLECNSSVGGIDYIEVADYDADLGPQYDADGFTITGFTSSPTWYKYELDTNTNTYVETITSSRENGTTFYNQVLTLNLVKLTADDQKELKLMAYSKPHVRVTDRNGNSFIMGLTKGAILGGAANTGAALGDFNGYNITLTADEPNPANWYTGA